LLTFLFAFEFGRSARFMDSTRWARSEAKVEAKLTTSNPADLLSYRSLARLMPSFAALKF